ncbi:hypothetical protein [Larsenimonas suaedae]|uniref:Carboxypeptidase regulatory-like domain-containing protein n=1 Tax=Larsenimonas suaedae TaxID=1851019 RepID=A0ABU1GXZ5_9GAMM|nr:hypothetical protein [Larsenimonas suaedae]MCM2972810.1 hypothetical protein [Larsenimonas suaedae]MDR5896909.1 hypothetical protein [Larsenimonas suaedae]
MNVRYFPWMLGAGMCVLSAATPVFADSPALERTEHAASQVDVSGYLKPSSDAMSQTIFLGDRPVDHDFDVAKAGDYRISSQSFPGESGNYRISAVLKNADGDVLARDEGSDDSSGFDIAHHLTPGKYTVTVTGQRFSPARDGNQSVTVWVRNMASNDGRTQGLSDSNRVARLAPAATAASSAAVASSSSVSERSGEAGAPSASAPEAASVERERASAPVQSEGAQPANAEAEPAQRTIVREVPIRTNGDVLKFEVVKAGQVHVESATFGGYRGTYRLKVRLLDQNGRVVAEDAGTGGDGDFDLTTRLEPGVYTVHVEGQKYGSAHSGTNSFTLRIRQQDAS